MEIPHLWKGEVEGRPYVMRRYFTFEFGVAAVTAKSSNKRRNRLDMNAVERNMPIGASIADVESLSKEQNIFVWAFYCDKKLRAVYITDEDFQLVYQHHGRGEYNGHEEEWHQQVLRFQRIA